MPRRDRPHNVVSRLRGHWRRSIHQPPGGRSAILALGRVLDDEAEARLPHRRDECLGPESFRQLLDTLSESAQIVSLESALQLHHDPLPRIALTFDGGWQDVATQVAPVLEHFALPASIFVPGESLRAPWQTDLSALGELLWLGEAQNALTSGLDELGLGELGLPLPTALPDARDERRSEAIHTYLNAIAPYADCHLETLLDAIWPTTSLAEHAIDAFSIRRLEQDDLIRFGTLAKRKALALDTHTRRCWQRDRQRLTRLCRHPLAASAWIDADEPTSLDRFASASSDAPWLMRYPGWLPLSISTQSISTQSTSTLSPSTHELPRFVVTRSLARSPGQLFDWLLGHLDE